VVYYFFTHFSGDFSNFLIVSLSQTVKQVKRIVLGEMPAELRRYAKENESFKNGDY